jgi:hypothetical protein
VVEFLYDPRYEDPAPPWGAVAGSRAAVEARIYSDGGTGTVDFGTPVATVNLSGPVAPARYTWTSDGLTPGATYLWVVRIATSSIESQNTRAISATTSASSGMPIAPVLSAVVM